MFDIVANLISSLASFLFPVFASYKALNANDPVQLTPWLMYWVVLATVLVVETWIGWVVKWVPFYQWFRCGFFLWLVLPQSQGATKLYLQYFHPWLHKHETDIENFISISHDKSKAVGIEYIRKFIVWAEEIIFGIRNAPPPEPPVTGQTYAQSLLSRFHLPPLGVAGLTEGFQAPKVASDWYSSIINAAFTGSQGGTPSGHAATSGNLIPPTIKSRSERETFINSQRERLRSLLRAYDNELASLVEPSANSSGVAPTNIARARSSTPGLPTDFDHIEHEEAVGGATAPPLSTSPRSSGWGLSTFGWSSGRSQPSTPEGELIPEVKPHNE